MGRCSRVLDGTSRYIPFHLRVTRGHLFLMLASDAYSCTEEHARQGVKEC